MKYLGPFFAGIGITALGLLAVAEAVVEPGAGSGRAYSIVDTPGPVLPTRVATAADLEVRDVTPPGVTRGPELSDELIRIAARAAAAPQPVEEPADPTVRYDRVVVLDAGHFRAIKDGAAVTVRIADIEAPAFEHICGVLEVASFNTSWRCGATARAELARLVGVRSIECVTVAEEGSTRIARCAVGGRDLAGWLVDQGWATPAEDAGETLLQAAEGARESGRGLYRDVEATGATAAAAATL